MSREWHPNGHLAEEREFNDRGRLVAIRRWAEDGTPLEPDSPRIPAPSVDSGPTHTRPQLFTYFAAIPPGRTRTSPAGVIRRSVVGGHPVDEAFTRSLDWKPTTALRDQQFGHTDTDHVEITEAEAEAIVSRISARLRDATG